jgi:hypothetical protein
VIEANIASWTLGKLLVDNGSSAEIIFADAFDKMGLNRDLLQPPDTPLYGFGGRAIHALGKVVLPVSFGIVQNARTEYLSFDVVEMYYPYNGILVVWTSLGPLPRWVPGPATRWAPGTTRLALHGT